MHTIVNKFLRGNIVEVFTDATECQTAFLTLLRAKPEKTYRNGDKNVTTYYYCVFASQFNQLSPFPQQALFWSHVMSLSVEIKRTLVRSPELKKNRHFTIGFALRAEIWCERNALKLFYLRGGGPFRKMQEKDKNLSNPDRRNCSSIQKSECSTSLLQQYYKCRGSESDRIIKNFKRSI